MIQDYQKFSFPDKKTGHGITAEVNWDTEDPAINDAKIIKFSFPKQKEFFVERSHLNEILFALGSPEDQRRLIPQNFKSVHWSEHQIEMVAKKDIRKGETIKTGPFKISVPCTIIRSIIGEDRWKKEVDKERKKGTGIIPVK